MPRLGNINQYEQKKAQRKADAMPTAVPPVQESVAPQSQQLREGFQQMGQMDAQQPVLQKVNPNEVYQSTRSQALGHESNLADPEKTQEFWNASPYEYWTEQVKANPENTYAILNKMYASKETPEEKRKRERREQLGEVFNNLGNLIGNAANLYYAGKSGYSIDLNTANEKHRERMQRIKDKQDALKQRQDELLMKYKVGDIQAAREAATKKEEREYNAKVAKAKADADAKAKELEYKRDLALKQIEHAFRIGQIDAQTAANMKRDAAKATSDKELEAFKQSNRIALKTTPSGNESVRTSFAMPNGDIYTRDTDLDDLEAMELARYIKDPSLYVRKDAEGKEYRDYKRAAVDAVKSGAVPADVLTRMGYKKSGGSSKGEKKSGSFGYGKPKKEDGYDLNDI